MGRDPRTLRTTITSDGSVTGEAIGVEVVVIDGYEVCFPKPLPGVPEYLAVAQAEARAEELRPKLTQGLEQLERAMAFQPNEQLVYEMRAAAGTAVGSAVIGLEAFANHHIARFPERAEGGGGAATNLPINERLKDVLPELLGCSPPQHEGWWADFRRVQGLAMLVRHPETRQLSRPGLDGQRPLHERLYRGEYRGAARMMLSAFEHLSPGWISPEAHAALPEPP